MSEREGIGTGLDRRGLLKYTGLGAAGLLASSFLAACSRSSGSSDGGSSKKPIRVGASLSLTGALA
jgi:hypothetical protein